MHDIPLLQQLLQFLQPIRTPPGAHREDSIAPTPVVRAQGAAFGRTLPGGKARLHVLRAAHREARAIQNMGIDHRR